MGGARGLAIGLMLLPALAAPSATPAAAPLLPGAVADVGATLAVVAEGNRVAGVDLTTGATRWTSEQGRWPLASAAGWIAVGAPDGADPRTMRVRFLRPADGELLVEAKPIKLPAPLAAKPSWEGEGLSVGLGNDSFTLWAWVPPPGAARNARAGRLRIRWRAQSFTGGGGMRPPDRGPVVSGLAYVDPATGAVEVGADDPAQGPEPAPLAMPPSWKREPGTIYWSWSWYGSAWTDKPRPFWIGDTGVGGYLGYESAKRRLVLIRFRAHELLSPVEIASGGEWAPQVSMDGRFLLLPKGNAGVETFTFYDLTRPGPRGAPPIALPHLEPRYRAPFAVAGNSLYYVAEGEGASVAEGTSFPRWLVSVDVSKGKVRWAHPLLPRVLGHPMAGTGN